MQEKIERLKTYIEESNRIVFFGGAGVSTESGIPDFRSAEGLFLQESGYNALPEEIISHSFFETNPKIFFEYYFKHLVHKEAMPNRTHQYLAELEKNGKDIQVVTQNIDGLHQKAGSQCVHELHGSIWRNYCLTCDQSFSLNELKKDQEGIPRCPHDQGIVRPDVVLYQEPLDMERMNQVRKAISEAELFIIAGTSLSVYPAAAMVRWFTGNKIVVINRTPIDLDLSNVLVFENELSEVFAKLTNRE
jgi:NAD-dependent deacetylase